MPAGADMSEADWQQGFVNSLGVFLNGEAIPTPWRLLVTREARPPISEEFSRVVPMIELSDEEIEAYVEWNARVLQRVVETNGITALHANHSVLMPQVAERVSVALDIPFSIMPHGSGLEFAVKRDIRFQRMAEQSFCATGVVFVHGSEMRSRVRAALPDAHGLDAKFVDLHLGVDTSQFEPVSRAERASNIARMLTAAAALPRGRTDRSTQSLLAGLRDGIELDELTVTMRAQVEFQLKQMLELLAGDIARTMKCRPFLDRVARLVHGGPTLPDEQAQWQAKGKGNYKRDHQVPEIQNLILNKLIKIFT